MTHISRRLPAMLMLLYMSVRSTMPAFAQQLEQSTSSQTTSVSIQDTSEHIKLTVGDILEILPSTDITAPNYSWILTQQRTFIQAGRTQTFRYRFLQPGTYSLIGEIQSADMATTVSRTFTIIAKAHERGIVGNSTSSVSVETGSGTLTGLVMIDPPMDTNKRVILGPNQQLVKFIPITQDIKPLSLDIDTATDSDKDGNASNDVDNKGTFFQLYSEPLFVWLSNPITDRKISITTVSSDGIAHVQDIDIFGADFAQQQGLIVSPIRFTAEQNENGAYAFTTKFEGNAPTAPLLYHWSFGDGQESLLLNPTHTFGINGTYTVVLQVRNLIDGQDVARNEQQITVTNAAASITSDASSSSNASVSNEATENTSEGNGGLSLTMILSFVGIFLLFIIFGIGITMLLSKLRRGRSLDQTFADLEKNVIFQDKDKKMNPAPLSIPATAIPTAPKAATPVAVKEAISTREENAASSAPVAMTARIDEKAAPGWLKKGLETPAVAKGSDSPVAIPQPQQPLTPPPAAAPKTTTPTASTPNAPTPSWLQKTPSAPATVPATVPAKPASTPPSLQATPIASKPTPPATSQSNATVPPWLQKAATVSAVENKTVPTSQAKPVPPVIPPTQSPVISATPVPQPPAQKPAEAIVAPPIASSSPAAKMQMAIPAQNTVPAAPPKTENTASPSAPSTGTAPATIPVASPSITPKPGAIVVPAPTVTSTTAPSVATVPSIPVQQPKPVVVPPAPTIPPKPITPVSTPAVTAVVSSSPQTNPVNPITPKPTVLAENKIAPPPVVTSVVGPNIQIPASIPTSKIVTETPIVPATSPSAMAAVPVQKPSVALDEPIAFIRADSLDQPKNAQNDQ